MKYGNEIIDAVEGDVFDNISAKDWSLEEEKEHFRNIQACFEEQFSRAFPDKLAPKTIVIIPSLTMDNEILSKIKGVTHYEERLLCMLMLLRMPRTHVVYVTSMPVDPVIIDYYLHLLPGVTGYHAHQRLHLMCCYDSSLRSLTEKIIERPRLVDRIKKSIPAGYPAHMACFNVTSLERSLAVQLGIPIYGCDPELFQLGNKSNSRKIFRECGLNVPPGSEDLHSPDDIIEALTDLKEEFPGLRKAVVKVNDGFSGDGNAMFSLEDLDNSEGIGQAIRKELYRRLRPVASLSVETFLHKFNEMGGIVESFIDGQNKASPSVQCRINPKGECVIISTHDQELDGDCGQIFTGAFFPANPAYAAELGEMGMKVSRKLRDKGVLGRFAIDFISVKKEGEWIHYPIEINLRKGGTTHPYIMLQFLTDGDYKAEEGIYYTANGLPRFYYSSDNLQRKEYCGITPHDLIDIAMLHGLHYDGTSQEGVMFHLIGALSEFGKIGVVCIGSSLERAKQFYERTVQVLKLETVDPLYSR